MSNAQSRMLKTLDAYQTLYPEEIDVIARIRALVKGHPDCFDRACLPGHITGSAWIVSPDYGRVLMTHHRKLDLWLQLGGHADGQTRPHLVALKEAREESGMKGFELVCPQGEPVPLDVDVHLIPARGAEPAHEHHDLRYLLIAPADETVCVSDESHAVRWFTLDELQTVTLEESVWRMQRKAAYLLAGRLKGVPASREIT